MNIFVTAAARDPGLRLFKGILWKQRYEKNSRAPQGEVATTTTTTTTTTTATSAA